MAQALQYVSSIQRAGMDANAYSICRRGWRSFDFADFKNFDATVSGDNYGFHGAIVNGE
jgi:hypothetical protein